MVAESCLRANALNSSVMGRKKTQGAANQTTRIQTKSIGQAASAQIVASALAIAEFRHNLRLCGNFVVNPLASNAVNPCGLALADLSSFGSDTFFGIISTVRLRYNSSNIKIGSVSVRSVALDLAKAEIQNYTVSNAMGTRNFMLIDIFMQIGN